jgi:hypothetical protein
VDRANDPKNKFDIGRAKTVLVWEPGSNPVAIVSEIVARLCSDGADRLSFRGPGGFKSPVLKHINSIVLPLADRITNELGISQKNYEISIVNIGAAASRGIGMEIGGFSADLPLFIALLSSVLQVPVRQDTVSTGHISSMEGDLTPVRGIPAKIQAALNSSGISAFLFPDLDKDSSLRALTPTEYEEAKQSLLKHKSDIRTYAVGNVHEATRTLMPDESIVFGSLRAGFFNVKPNPSDPNSPASRTVKFFCENNKNRFWDALESFLLDHHLNKAKLLIQTYADFHIRNHFYPESFGQDLSQLVVSLPPSIRSTADLFPLLSTDLCISLSRHAKQSDYDDVPKLYKAVFGEVSSEIPFSPYESQKIKSSAKYKEEDLLEWLLSEISDENLSRKIGHPIDEARGRYASGSVTVKNGFEFNEAIAAFYAHMFRHTASPTGPLDKNALSADAIDVVEEAFAQKGGYDAALSEGIHGINGGMRFVFDAMAEYLKKKHKKKYAYAVFKTALDSRDWDPKPRLMKAFMDRIGAQLPAELRNLSPEQLAHRWEEIISLYVESMDKFSDVLRRF